MHRRWRLFLVSFPAVFWLLLLVLQLLQPASPGERLAVVVERGTPARPACALFPSVSSSSPPSASVSLSSPIVTVPPRPFDSGFVCLREIRRTLSVGFIPHPGVFLVEERLGCPSSAPISSLPLASSVHPSKAAPAAHHDSVTLTVSPRAIVVPSPLPTLVRPPL